MHKNKFLIALKSKLIMISLSSVGLTSLPEIEELPQMRTSITLSEFKEEERIIENKMKLWKKDKTLYKRLKDRGIEVDYKYSDMANIIRLYSQIEKIKSDNNSLNKELSILIKLKYEYTNSENKFFKLKNEYSQAYEALCNKLFEDNIDINHLNSIDASLNQEDFEILLENPMTNYMLYIKNIWKKSSRTAKDELKKEKEIYKFYKEKKSTKQSSKTREDYLIESFSRTYKKLDNNLSIKANLVRMYEVYKIEKKYNNNLISYHLELKNEIILILGTFKLTPQQDFAEKLKRQKYRNIHNYVLKNQENIDNIVQRVENLNNNN